MSLVLSLFSVSARAKHGEPNDHALCREEMVEVHSTDSISPDECRRAAKMGLAAWKFDLGQMRWRSKAEMEGPLTVEVLSDERMKKEHPGDRGFAYKDSFLMRESLIDDPTGNLTMAHEFGHLQAHRALKKSKAIVPKYFREGHGLLMNRLYAEQLQAELGDKDRDGWTKQPKIIKALGVDELKTIYADDSYASDPGTVFKMETMGLYLLEHLRWRHGMTDVAPRVGRVFEEVGAGKTYEEAFKDVMGMPVDSVIAEILALFEKTSGNPDERLKGLPFLAWAGK